MEDSEDGRWMTYPELGSARGINRASANELVRRHRWRRQTDDRGTVRILVPPEWANPAPDSQPDNAPDSPRDSPPDIFQAISALEAILAALREDHAAEIARLGEQLEREQSRGAEAEERERALRERLAGEVDRLMDAHRAEIETERGRADAAEARGEAAVARLREDHAAEIGREQKRAESAEARVTEAGERERGLREQLAAAGVELAAAQAQAITQRASRERDAAEIVKVGGQLAREQTRAEAAEARLDDERRRGDQAEGRAGRAEERAHRLRDKIEELEAALAALTPKPEPAPVPQPSAPRGYQDVVPQQPPPVRSAPHRTHDSGAKVAAVLAKQAERRWWRWSRRGRAGG